MNDKCCNLFFHRTYETRYTPYHPAQAIEDIDLALEISEEPCPRAYITKGDALYHLGDFEHALGMCNLTALGDR